MFERCHLLAETSVPPSHKDGEEMGLGVWNAFNPRHGFSDCAFLGHFAHCQPIRIPSVFWISHRLYLVYFSLH